MMMKSVWLAAIAALLWSGSAEAQSLPFGGGGIPNVSNAIGSLPMANGGEGRPVASCGALGVASDDGPAIQNCFNYAAAYGVGLPVTFDSISYSVKTNLTYDSGVTSAEGNGALLDASANTNSGFLLTFNQASSLVDNTITYKNIFENFRFVGPGTGTGSRGTLDLFGFNSTTSGHDGRMTLNNISATNFRNWNTYENNAFSITESKVQGYNMGTCWYMHSGYTNYGENIVVDSGSLCTGSDVGADNEQNSDTNTFSFSDTAFDQDTVDLIDTKGNINCDLCHFESVGGNLTAPLFQIGANSGATIRLHGGDILLDGSGPFSGTFRA
jgi:hypothetical protein